MARRQGRSCGPVPSLPLGFTSDRWKCFSQGSGASALVLLTQKGPWSFRLLSSPARLRSVGALPPEPSCLDLLSERRASRKCGHSPGSVCRRFPTPGSLLVPLQAQVAAGWMTQVRSAGQTSPCSHPSRVTTLISCPVITVPPPSEGGLARARGTGRNVVILACVLLPKMFLELGWELSPWPLHCLMMSWRLLG